MTSTGNGAITFAGTVQSASHNSLNLSSGGTIVFGGTVGGPNTNVTALAALTVGGGGTTQIDGGSINTTGFAQNYNEDVTLGSAFTSLAGIVDFNAGLTLGTDVVQVAGTLNFTTTTTLTTTFTGTAPAQIGHILVGGGNTTYGNATLALVYSGFTPAAGDSFDIVSNGGFGIGQFTNAPAPGPDAIDGTSYLVTYSGTDGGGDFILTVGAAPTITSAASTTFTVGTPGSFTVTTTGQPTPSLTESGALSSGVTFTDNGNGTATLAGTPTGSGTFVFTITASNGILPNAVQIFTLLVNPGPMPPTPPVAANFIAVGADAGGGPQVVVYNAITGALVASFFAFAPSFTGGVRVAVDNINGSEDIVCAAGPGGGPQVAIYNGNLLADGTAPSAALVASFFAFAPTFTGGVFIAAGTSTSGQNWLAAGAGAGGGPQVVVWTANAILAGAASATAPTVLTSFYAFAPSFGGGVTVALGDVTGSGKLDVIAGAGPGGGPQVIVVDGTQFGNIPGSGILPGSVLLASFYAYNADFLGGVFVTAGGPSGTGAEDIITGPGPGSTSQISLFTGTGTPAGSFVDPRLTGVRVGFITVNGQAQILAAPGPGSPALVDVFNAQSFGLLDEFFAFSSTFLGGAFIAG